MPGGSRPRAVFAFGACGSLGGASLKSGWPSSGPSPHEERFSMAYVGRSFLFAQFVQLCRFVL